METQTETILKDLLDQRLKLYEERFKIYLEIGKEYNGKKVHRLPMISIAIKEINFEIKRVLNLF